MFAKSNFNQDLFAWNVSKVKNMALMFYKSKFNQNISEWDVSNVTVLDHVFADSIFSQDISNWKPKKLKSKINAFIGSQLEKDNLIPYWANVEVEFLEQAIDAYQLQNRLIDKLDPVGSKEAIKINTIKI